MRLRNWLAALFVVLSAGCATSDDSSESRAQRCERLRDHLVDLRLESSSVDVESHRAALRNALGATFVDTCVSTVTAKQVKCALEADTSAKAFACTNNTVN